MNDSMTWKIWHLKTFWQWGKSWHDINHGPYDIMKYITENEKYDIVRWNEWGQWQLKMTF